LAYQALLTRVHAKLPREPVASRDNFSQTFNGYSHFGGGKRQSIGAGATVPRPLWSPGRASDAAVLCGHGGGINLAGQQITLGRANDALLALNDDYASAHHGRIFPHDAPWLVEDLGSINGTYLRRQKAALPTPVPLGVPIRIGKTVLELRR
jgi:hypothetical protein